jgi:hypothetical protein
MKSCQVLAAICTILSVASAADLGSRAAAASSSTKTEAVGSEIALATTQTRRLDEGPWDTGTKVYKEFPNEGWWSGTISSYSQATGMYTVTWEDGSTDYYDDSNEIDQMVAFAASDPQNNPAGAADVSGAYPAGTKVSYFEDGEWYDGAIIKYGSGSYTIQWDEDDEIEEIPSGAEIDQMVEDSFGDDDGPPDGYQPPAEAPTDPSVAVGIDVSYYDDEDGAWVDGQITAYKNNVYTVIWEDGSEDEYDDSGDDFQELKQAITDSFGDDDAAPTEESKILSGPKFPTGTAVSDWEDEEWVDGEVIGLRDGKYLVRWEDEGDLEYYESHNAEDMQELTKMAKDAQGDDDAPPDSFFEDEDLWKIGTPVAVTEDNILWYGKIDGFSDGAYSIAWDNGESETLDNYNLVNTMVSNAIENPKGMSGTGKFFLSLFVLSVCAVGSIFGYKFYQRRRTEKSNRDLDFEVDGFRDQPGDLPKII